MLKITPFLFEEKIESFIRRYRLVNAGEKILVAVSGGPDSMCLLTVPVSYTHLRAHETVLDLVCRLLLEKKKKSNHQHYYVHSQYNYQEIKLDLYIDTCN